MIKMDEGNDDDNELVVMMGMMKVMTISNDSLSGANSDNDSNDIFLFYLASASTQK